MSTRRLLFLMLTLAACRTTQLDDKREFAKGQDSSGSVATVAANHNIPNKGPGQPLPTFPKPGSEVEKGAYYVLCSAREQLASPQALTVKALMAATHTQTCEAGEIWLRDRRNASLHIDSEALVELQSLALLQNYPHIQDVFVKIAKGISAVCPLGKPQVCHFLKPDFE